jgi:hypothetical protein
MILQSIASNNNSMEIKLDDSQSETIKEQVINQKVIIYAHDSKTFQEIRELDGISASDVDASLNCEKNREMVFKAG